MDKCIASTSREGTNKEGTYIDVFHGYSWIDDGRVGSAVILTTGGRADVIVVSALEPEHIEFDRNPGVGCLR